MTTNTTNIYTELNQVVETSAEKLKMLDNEVVRVRPAPLKWSIQEILGHLIDSAANNHQRFIRAQQVNYLNFPGYEQDIWVQLQDWNNSTWLEMLELWRLLNLHLAMVIANIPNEKLSVECKIGESNAVTLGYLVEDYIVHLKHHLKQIEKQAAV